MAADDTSRSCGCDLTGMTPPAIHLVDGHPDDEDCSEHDPMLRLDAAIKRAEAAEAELERLHSWRGLLSLMDEHWPENVFPTLTDDPARDTGPRLISALRRAEAAEAERDTYRERWRQLMRDHEAVVKERDELEAENERLRDTARNYEIAMHAARGERDGAWAEAERLRDDLKQERRSHRGAHDAGVATLAERDAAREQVRQRDEVIERVRALVDEWSQRGAASGPFPDRVVLDVDTEVLGPLRAALDGDGR